MCMWRCVQHVQCKANYLVLVSCMRQARRSSSGRVAYQRELEEEADILVVACVALAHLKKLASDSSLYVCAVSGVISRSSR